MKKPIFGILRKLSRFIRAPNISHRELENDFNPAIERVIRGFVHTVERAEKSRGRWRKFTFLLIVTFSVLAWVKWQEEASKDILIEQEPFRTISVTGSGWSTAHVAVIPIRGSIEGDPLGPAEVSNTPRYLHDTLDLARKESNLAAVVIYIESTGGDMYASTESYRLVHNFAKRSKVPVYAYVPRQAHSGAYYIAVGTGEIIADPVAEIGNIGVIVRRLNTHGFGRRFGIQMESIKTGQHKDAGAQWKRPSAADRAIDQRAVDVMFEQFLEAIAASRSKYSLDELKLEAKKQGGVTSGAWFVARDAQEKGLIDKTMTFEEFLVYVAKNIAKNDKRKFHNAEFVKYDEKLSILDDWKSHFKKTQMSSGSSKDAVKGDLGTCLMGTSILEQIFSPED